MNSPGSNRSSIRLYCSPSSALSKMAPLPNDGTNLNDPTQYAALHTAIDGETVESVGQLLTRLRRYEPGDTAVLEVQRGGEPVEVTVELLNRPEDT